MGEEGRGEEGRLLWLLSFIPLVSSVLREYPFRMFGPVRVNMNFTDPTFENPGPAPEETR